MFVLDCSVIMAACFEDEDSAYATRVLESLGHVGAFVPPLWLYEVGNTLLMAERRKRINPLKRQEYLRAIRSLPIEICSPIDLSDLSEIISFCQSLNLTFYDAAYLNLALQKSLALATLDIRLQEAALKAGISKYYP